jgi:DNA (cytosine-5)-methyltransferase 1
MNKLKVLSLFSGVGMFDYGLEKTGGFETVAFCEIDKDCQKVLKKHWPHVLQYYDVKELRADHLGRMLFKQGRFSDVDVVTASWPCQGHSTAGKKRGLNDSRSGLWKETKRVLQEVKPTWFIGENSANLRTTGLTEVLQDLRQIGFNHIEWHVLPACAFGAIHRRERIYIIANRNSLRSGVQTIASQETKQEWGPKAWTSFYYRERITSQLNRRAYDDTKKLDEVDRKRRVKQCGNSLFWPIVKFIGEQILKYERG